MYVESYQLIFKYYNKIIEHMVMCTYQTSYNIILNTNENYIYFLLFNNN